VKAKPRRSRRISGFLLMEVVIGALVFTTVFAGFVAVSRLTEHGMRKFRNHNFSRFLAVQQMETCLARDYRSIPTYIAGQPTLNFVVQREVDGVEARQDFRVTQEVPATGPITTEVVVTADCLDDASPPFELRTVVFFTR
jgi:hypothetical protein